MAILGKPMKEVLQLKNYINGEWVDSKTKEYGEVWCPATGEKIGEVPFSTAEDIDKAVQAAKKDRKSVV